MLSEELDKQVTFQKLVLVIYNPGGRNGAEITAPSEPAL